jgi:hypothetical protein
VIGGDRASEVTGGDERTDGWAQVVSGRATREGKSAADEWGRPVSGGGGAAPTRAGAWGMGRVGRAGSVARGGEERRLGRIWHSRGGGEIFLFLFLFLFLLSPFFSFEQIFSYIFLGVKNILCEVLLKIMVYAYDEMPYEVGYEEIIKGG